MSTQVQFRRGSTAQHASMTGAAAEVTVDTTKNVVVVHDGSTAGGHPAATEAAVALKADIASPTFTGTPQAPTATAGTNTTQIATTAFVTTAVAAASSGVSDGNKGDITVSGSGSTWSVNAGAVTLAKLVDATATSRVLGRATAGSGDFEELTASQVADFIGSTRGSILYRGASGWAALTPGTSGYVLTSNGAGADPTYQAAAGGGSPGGSSGQVQYNNASAFGGAANLEISGGDPILVASTPSAPSASRTALHAMSLAGRVLPAFRGQYGAALPMAAHPASARRYEVYSTNNSATVGAIGISASAAGTATARAMADGSVFSMSRRFSMLSSATAGNSGSLFGTRLTFALGSAAGLGGFTYVARFGVNDAATVADSRTFVGLVGRTTVIPNSNPSNLTDLIGVGCDNGETTLSMIHNDASGTATKVSLGANFPSQTLSTDVYELWMYAPPNASTVGYRVTRINTGDVATGTLSTDLPAGSTLLAPHLWRNNGTTALAVDLCIMSLYIETDN